MNITTGSLVPHPKYSPVDHSQDAKSRRCENPELFRIDSVKEEACGRSSSDSRTNGASVHGARGIVVGPEQPEIEDVLDPAVVVCHPDFGRLPASAR